MANKLLLIEDVEALGRKGEIVSVKPGYARNFLLPQGYAIIADKNAVRMQTRLKAEREKQAVVDKKESEELAVRLEGLTLETTVKVDHDGHMYGSVSALDIAHLIQTQAGIALEKRSVLLPHAIKEVGVKTINIRLKEGVAATVTLKIIPEEVKGVFKQAAAAPEAEEA